MSMFRKAEKKKLKARVAIDGPSGSGKTYTALRAVCRPGWRVAIIDTEHRSGELYVGESPDGHRWEYDTCQLTSYHPDNYCRAIEEAGRSGYDAIVIDSLSHAWIGAGGALDMIDNSGEKNSYFAWAKVTPVLRVLVETILASQCHIFATLRTKTAYEIEKDSNGRNVPKKIGTKPEFREGLEYEFAVVGDMDIDHNIKFTKSRCSVIEGKTFAFPGPAAWEPLWAWLDEGVEVTQATPEQVATITAIFAEKGITNGAAANRLQRLYGKGAIDLLTVVEADDLLRRLGK